MKYHAMEYLQNPGKGPVMGYVFLEDNDYKRWKKNPIMGEVKGYAVVIGMESCAEWGKILNARMWDYGRTYDKLPEDFENIDEWLDNNFLRD